MISTLVLCLLSPVLLLLSLSSSVLLCGSASVSKPSAAPPASCWSLPPHSCQSQLIFLHWRDVDVARVLCVFSFWDKDVSKVHQNTKVTWQFELAWVQSCKVDWGVVTQLRHNVLHQVPPITKETLDQHLSFETWSPHCLSVGQDLRQFLLKYWNKATSSEPAGRVQQIISCLVTANKVYGASMWCLWRVIDENGSFLYHSINIDMIFVQRWAHLI